MHEKGLLSQELPLWLSALTGKIYQDVRLFPSPINHVLVNEYLPGQGIMPHQDGPAYFPVVAIISLGSPAVMRFSPHPRLLDAVETTLASHAQAFSVALMPGSLLVFKDSAYQDYLHGIDDCLEHIVDETVLNLDKVKLATVNERSSDPGCLSRLEVSNICGPIKTEHSSKSEDADIYKHYMEGTKEDALKFEDSNIGGALRGDAKGDASKLDRDGENTKEDISNSSSVIGSLRRNGTRVSLTCRLVTRVHRNLIKL